MKIKIIGGSHAGIACAIRAREEYPDSQIVIYERQRNIGFVAQSIPYYLSGNSQFLKLSSYTTINELEKLGILVKIGTSVTDVDLESKKLQCMDVLNHSIFEEDFDKLILATGSYPSLPVLQGDSLREKFFVIKDYKDAVRLKKFMDESRTVIVIGGGAIGTEIAKVMTDAHIKTTLLHSSEHLLNRYLDKDIADQVEHNLASKVIKNVAIKTIEEDEVFTGNVTKKSVRVITNTGEEFVADGVIYATGFRPNSFLLHDKVELGDKGAVIVDEYMKTSHPDVFAVGDCATSNVSNVKEPVYTPHASDAIRQGEVAAVNLNAPKLAISKSQGTLNLNFDSENTLCVSGLSYRNALREGWDCDTVFVRNDHLEGNSYYESWLVYEKNTHKILGIQSKGNDPEISSHADLISLAIQNNMTIEDIEYTDFYFRHGFKNPKSFTKLYADKIRQKERLEKFH